MPRHSHALIETTSMTFRVRVNLREGMIRRARKDGVNLTDVFHNALKAYLDGPDETAERLDLIERRLDALERTKRQR